MENKFKSIDDLMKGYYLMHTDRIYEDNLYDWILFYDPELFLSTLISETNKPSEHDLSIIRYCTLHKNSLIDARLIYVNKILEFYKNRKDT